MRSSGEEPSFENRFQFYALASKVMRSVLSALVDPARTRAAQRAGERRRIPWIEAAGCAGSRALDLSVPTIERRWRLARAWLFAELRR